MSCLDDGGYRPAEQIRADAVNFASNVRRVAAAAIAIDNAARLISNYRKQRDLSDRQMRIAEERQHHMQETYWPREIQFLEEFGTPEDIEDAYALGRRYGGRLVSTLARAFAKQIKEADCSSSRYCTSHRGKTLQDLLLVRAQALANARILGHMIGFAEVQARRDRNDARRRAAVGLGRGLISKAASLYGSAGEGLANVGKHLTGGLSSALTAFGYADRDPGPSAEMQSLHRQRQMELQQGQAQAPFTVGGQQGAQMAPPEFGGGFMQQADLQVGGSPVTLERSPRTPWQGLQHERWNEGDVGNRNLAREGSHTYSFVDSDGDRGEITVNMSDFNLQFVDDRNPGDS